MKGVSPGYKWWIFTVNVIKDKSELVWAYLWTRVLIRSDGRCSIEWWDNSMNQQTLKIVSPELVPFFFSFFLIFVLKKMSIYSYTAFVTKVEEI